MSTDKFNDQGGSGSNQGFGGGSNQGGPDELEMPLKVISFCVPLVGAILYATNKDKFPNKAKTAGRNAIIGFVIILILNIIVRVALN